MVLSHDNIIIVSNDKRPPVTSARQPSVQFIHPFIAQFGIKLRKKYHAVLLTASGMEPVEIFVTRPDR